MIVSVLKTLGYLAFKAVTMTAADPMCEYFQHLQSLMISFHKSMSQLFKGNNSESALDMQKNLMEYYHDLHKALQSWYKTLNIKEEKPELSCMIMMSPCFHFMSNEVLWRYRSLFLGPTRSTNLTLPVLLLLGKLLDLSLTHQNRQSRMDLGLDLRNQSISPLIAVPLFLEEPHGGVGCYRESSSVDGWVVNKG